jgi:hypothetical protein
MNFLASGVTNFEGMNGHVLHRHVQQQLLEITRGYGEGNVPGSPQGLHQLPQKDPALLEGPCQVQLKHFLPNRPAADPTNMCLDSVNERSCGLSLDKHVYKNNCRSPTANRHVLLKCSSMPLGAFRALVQVSADNFCYLRHFAAVLDSFLLV